MELYISKFDELIKRTNNFTKISSESINIISNELNDMIKDLNKIKTKYEEMAKNLSIPLKLEQMLNDINITEEKKGKKRRLDELEFEINNYKRNVTKLYNLLDKPFEYFLWCFTNFPKIIEEYTKDSVLISTNIVQVTTEANNNLNILEISNSHNILIKI